LTATASSQVSAISVAPASGTGSSQNFTFTFSDSQNASNISYMAMLFSGSSTSLTNACYLLYGSSTQTVSLFYDHMNGQNVRPASSSTPLQNSQCSIGALTVTSSGLSATIAGTIAFTPGFAGTQNAYMYASDSSGVNTGWVQNGTWTVPASAMPSNTSVAPASGTGSSQNFTFTFSDSQSAANISNMAMLFSSSPTSLTNACYLLYNSSTQMVSLFYDNMNGQNVRPASSSAPLQNSQCNAGALTVISSGLSTTIAVNIAFTPAFAGTQNVYMYASDSSDGVNTGWVQKGTWMVP
jgi:hypothetical protein